MSWKTIYSEKNIKKWGLPATSSINHMGYARGIVITWTEMEKAFRALDPPPEDTDNIWYVVCDVLILDDNPIINDQLFVFARHIELKSDIALLIPENTSSFTLVTQEIIRNNEATSLEASFLSSNPGDDPINVKLRPISNRAATIFRLKAPGKIEKLEWKASQNIINDFSDNLGNGEALLLGMVSSFQVASIMASLSDSGIESALYSFSQTPFKLAIDQFAWIAAICDINPDSRILAGQARTQLSWIIKKSQGLVLVPPLDFSVYRDMALSLTTILNDISASYDKWIDMERSNDNWLTQAKLTLALKSNESALQSQLEDHAESKLKKMIGAETEGSAQLQALHSSLIEANFNFEAGVKIWKHHNEISAAFTLILDIVKFGIAIGKIVAMVAAPGAGTAAAAASSAGGNGDSESSDDSTEDSDKADSISSQFGVVKKLAGPVGEAGGAAFAIVGDIGKIIEIGKTADSMNSMADDTLNKVDDALDKTFTVAPLKGLDLVTGGQQVWESLKVTMDDVFSMKKNLLDTIEGGPQFRVAFRHLVIGGEAYCSTRLAVAEASNSLVEAKLRTKSANKCIDLAKNTQEEFENNDALYEQLKQEAFGRLLDAKRAVYLELEHYQQASNYFTLSERDHELPSITASVSDFLRESAAISGFKLILEDLTPIPLSLELFPIYLPITDAQRKDNAIVVQIDVYNEIFKPYARIRIDKMDLSLWDKNEEQIFVREINIGTGGRYRDIIPNGGIATFSGNPFIRRVTYNSKGDVIMGSTVYGRFEDVIFKPTPFTTWTFKLPDVKTVKEVAFLKLTISGAASPGSRA